MNQPSALPPKPRHFELRMSSLYLVAFVAMGIHIPFFPLWLEYLAFTPGEIGIILAVPLIVRVVATPLLTALGDHARDRADVLAGAAFAAFVVSLGYFLTPSYSGVLIVSILFAIVWAAHVPLLDSLSLSGVRRYGSRYTAMRIWGSIAFVATNFALGWVLSVSGPSIIPVVLTASLAAMCVAQLIVPRLGRPRQATAGVPGKADLRELMDRNFLLLVTGIGVIVGSHGFYYAFSSIYWKALGVPDTVIGSLWAWGVIAEVLIFALFQRFFGRYAARTVILIGGTAAILRWAVFPLIGGSGTGIGLFFLLQTLHAFSTGLMLIAVQKVIAAMVPEQRSGSAQGLAYFANGAAMALTTLGSGWMFERFAGYGFWSMVLVAGLGTALAFLAQPQSSGDGGNTSEPS